jgi:hypothetical protein
MEWRELLINQFQLKLKEPILLSLLLLQKFLMQDSEKLTLSKLQILPFS